jgi:beta-galactosidase
VDDQGITIPDSEAFVQFEIEGNGSLQAVGNGNPKDMKSFRQPGVNAYRGKCMVIIRAGEESGEIRVTARS